MKKACAIIVSMLVLMIALPAGAFFFGPLRAHQPGGWIPIASISSLAGDGSPHLIAVRVKRNDAWNQMPDEILGRIYIRRIPETGAVVVLHALHSRGIPVDYDEVKRIYRCRCWGMEFDRDGKFLGPKDAFGSSDGIPSIEAKVSDGEVLVRYPTDWRDR